MSMNPSHVRMGSLQAGHLLGSWSIFSILG